MQKSKQKILSYMGFAKKARKLIDGYNTVMLSMDKGKVKLLILCEGLSENTIKKLTSKANSMNIKYRIYGDSDEISHITGTSGKSIFAITDENFSKVILEEIDHIKSLNEEVF